MCVFLYELFHTNSREIIFVTSSESLNFIIVDTKNNFCQVSRIITEFSVYVNAKRIRI